MIRASLCFCLVVALCSAQQWDDYDSKDYNSPSDYDYRSGDQSESSDLDSGLWREEAVYLTPQDREKESLRWIAIISLMKILSFTPMKTMQGRPPMTQQQTRGQSSKIQKMTNLNRKNLTSGGRRASWQNFRGKVSGKKCILDQTHQFWHFQTKYVNRASLKCRKCLEYVCWIFFYPAILT